MLQYLGSTFPLTCDSGCLNHFLVSWFRKFFGENLGKVVLSGDLYEIEGPKFELLSSIVILNVYVRNGSEDKPWEDKGYRTGD